MTTTALKPASRDLLKNWMLDCINGKDTLECSEDICVGVVMTLGDYPWDNMKDEEIEDWPIRGITKDTREHLSLTSVKMGMAPVATGKGIVEKLVPVSAGSYVLIATGLGKTVEAARSSVYAICDEIYWPPHSTYRIDIGCRLEDDLPTLQEFGYAKGMDYGKS